ncbi:MAG TPA: DUF1844 domain-containing protein [Acidobacteriaceae bacterium]|jgi:hypothetical protein|nr:DUF1844 domain-containing protein [Acidobacteriaceae bacterium]
MSDTPKFTVVDRRKFHADDDSTPAAESPTSAPPAEANSAAKPTAVPSAGSSVGPRLVEPISSAKSEPAVPAVAVVEEEEDFGDDPQLPPAPSEEESRLQKLAYDQGAERLDDLVRAQNPGAPPQEKIGFEHLVQQLYLSAMMQMGAGTPEGQRPRIDILGARQTIDLLGVVLDKSKGNLTPNETRTLDTVLYELHATFLELTRMISAQPPMPPPPGAKR